MAETFDPKTCGGCGHPIEAWGTHRCNFYAMPAKLIEDLKNQHHPTSQINPQSADYRAGLAAGLKQAADLMEVSKSAIRLAAGEMTAQEMRTVLAILKWRKGVIEAHLPENE